MVQEHDGVRTRWCKNTMVQEHDGARTPKHDGVILILILNYLHVH